MGFVPFFRRCCVHVSDLAFCEGVCVLSDYSGQALGSAQLPPFTYVLDHFACRCFSIAVIYLFLYMGCLCSCCRYIKTSGNATVDHLSKYLAVRLALEELRSKGESNQMNLETASEKQYTIYIATANGQFTVSS